MAHKLVRFGKKWYGKRGAVLLDIVRVHQLLYLLGVHWEQKDYTSYINVEGLTGLDRMTDLYWDIHLKDKPDKSVSDTRE